MDDEGAKLFGGSRKTSNTGNDKPLYQQRGLGTTSRFMQYAFIAVVVIMVVITMILSIYQGVKNSGLSFLLGLSLCGFVAIQVLMMWFVKKGDLPTEKLWFLYLVGGCIVLEAIFTNVLLFQQ